MAEDVDTIVDVHYNGVFTPTPLMYFNGVKASVPYTVVNKMNFPDFIPFLEKLTNERCGDVYYCPHEEEEADLEDEDLVSIDDVDSILEDGLKAEHVEDDEVISLKRNFNDHFLNKLCPIQNDDLVQEDHNAIRPIYPRHDHTQEWNEMKPRLGMKYSTTAELKYSLSCYAVANGYDLWAGIPLRCTICQQTGHNKATCLSKPTPAPSTTGPSQSTPASSTAGPSQSTPAPVKRTPVKKAFVKKAPVKRSHMKKVPLNDAGRVRKFSERITEIGLQKNVKLKDGTGCSQDKPVTLE
ncbi:unnamed protein product [Lactuca virosa]|uniref:Uncharacterized protein n=1 Tax=Lactuca virosa TaxID=75947 RepID=A0AAU9LKQ1_9ASTR|nr:unnamed protein product [Lactuca virosa]